MTDMSLSCTRQKLGGPLNKILVFFLKIGKFMEKTWKAMKELKKYLTSLLSQGMTLGFL